MPRALQAVIIALCLLSLIGPVSPRLNTVTPIQHVVVIMQENHSFDNYFGTYPTANNTLDLTGYPLAHVNGLSNHICLPLSGSCVPVHLADSEPSMNPVEGQLTYEQDYANGGMGFAANSGPQSAIYYDYHTVTGYWDY